jgi:hypothetical protein
MIILKIFARDFACVPSLLDLDLLPSSERRPIGILYIVLAAFVFLISLARRTRDYSDFADQNVVETSRFAALLGSVSGRSELPPASKRVWSKRKFTTSGATVVLLTLATIGMEAALLVLILRL